MTTLNWYQCSLGSLFAVTMVAVPAMLGVLRNVPVPDFSAVDPIVWTGAGLFAFSLTVIAGGAWLANR